MVGIVGHDRRLSEVTLSEQISMVDYLRKVAGNIRKNSCDRNGSRPDPEF